MSIKLTEYMLFLDMDRASLRLAVDEAKRLQSLFSLGEADIYESSPGVHLDARPLGGEVTYISNWHIVYRTARLTWTEVERILRKSRCSLGYKYFSLEAGDQTLRIGPKGATPPPKLIGVVKDGHFSTI
jgi:hypothetical protein